MLPQATQARKAIWDAVNPHTGLRRIDEVFPKDLRSNTREDMMLIRFRNGSTWQVLGSDNYDSFVGSPPRGIVFSEWALCKPQAWSYARPILLENNGWALFNGTPRGMNHHYEMYNSYMSDDDWFVERLTAAESGLFSQEQLDKELAEYINENGKEIGEALFRQEYMTDFTAISTDDLLITSEMVDAAKGKHLREPDYAHSPRIIGVDVARYGRDRSVIQKRQGLYVHEPIVLDNVDNMALASRVAHEICEWKADAIFIDAGRGEGVIDRLRQLGFSVSEINFGGKPINPRYANKVTEMWALVGQELDRGMALPDHRELAAELTGRSYMFDSAGRMILESKEKMRREAMEGRRSIRSPDHADALALTFAQPVAPKTTVVDEAPHTASAVHEYDPFAY